jgi:hypothetical protein
LAAQAILLDNDTTLSPEDSESLVLTTRKFGNDWLSPLYNQYIEQVISSLDKCEVELTSRFAELKNQKILENDDRIQFQLDAIERHLEFKTNTLEDTKKKHLDNDRPSLVKATQSKIDNLKVRMNEKRETIKLSKNISPNSDSICWGLIKVVE